MADFVDGDAFSWGDQRKVEDAGNLSLALTYRFAEGFRWADLLIRAEFTSFELPEGKPVKISVMPIIQFPEASSGFPVYFGVGLGGGVYTKQINDESDVSIDYTLLGGVRLFNVFANTGFYLEAAIRNHLHLLSSGQFNGTTIAAGTVFTF